MTYPRNAWYPALWSQDLKPGALVPRTFLGEPVVLFRRPDGAPVAMQDVCPHRFAPLHRGELLPGGGIRCMYHGLEFSPEGQCVRNPHGDGALPRNCSVRTYPVVEKHTLAWIWMGERAPDAISLPDFDILDPREGLTTHRDSLVMSAGYRLLGDNLMDLSHAAFLHDGILNRREAAWAEIKVEQQGTTLRCTRWMPGIPIARLYNLLFRNDGKPVDHWTDMRWDPPGCFLLDVGVHPPGRSRDEGFGIYATHLLTPENETSTHYLFAVTRKPDASEEKVRQEVAELRRYAFEKQDKPMIEAQQRNIEFLESTGSADPALIASIDAGPMRMQRILDQLVAKESETLRAHRMSDYPMLGFVGKHGGSLAVVAALLPLAGSVVPVTMGFSAWWLAAGFVSAAVVFVVARSYVELVRVMIDMLLPQVAVFFYLSKVASWLLNPLHLLMLLLALGVLLSGMKWRRTGMGAIVLGVLAMFSITFLPISQWALRPLEQEIPRPSSLPAGVTGIVLLGGSQDPLLTEAYGMSHIPKSAERMTAFASLARRYPQAKLVFTGGSAALISGGPTEAQVVKLFFQEQGLDPGRLILENQSRTTYENAALSKALVKPDPAETWILVTSAYHMPRSVAVFQKADWKVLPYPVGYRTLPSISFGLEGEALTQFNLLDIAIHEWVGYTAYRLTGRI